MTATLYLFTRAAQPKNYLSDLRLPAHAQIPLLEIIVSHYASRKRHWDLVGTSEKDQAAETEALIRTINTNIVKVKNYGIRMFKGRIVPAAVYCAIVGEILGQGKTDAYPWQHADAEAGFRIMQRSRKPHRAHKRMPQKAANFNALFSRLFVLTYNLEETLDKGRQKGQTLANCAPYRAFIDQVWPPTPLSVDAAVLATRVRNMINGAQRPARKLAGA
ncbi:MAG: hypothetical protein KGQ41_08655 [Alphaproteobacteria bacterium]|nr:hypothetical protein [Alphaproteobacteria bacterium]